MSDEDAFLAAIAAAPLDDTPRLVYADWLEDRDDPRAEYLRLEVERHRLRPRDKDRRAELTVRLEALRHLADLHWLPRIDRGHRLSIFWPRDYCRAAEVDGDLGRPLARAESAFITSVARRGDYVYAITARAGCLYLIGRMRLRKVLAVTEARPPVVRAYGTEGTPARLDRPVPTTSLPAVGRYNYAEEVRLKLDAAGRPGSLVPLYGSHRLLPSAAGEFDRLLRDG